jgi:hypothetical protein
VELVEDAVTPPAPIATALVADAVEVNPIAKLEVPVALALLPIAKDLKPEAIGLVKLASSGLLS